MAITRKDYNELAVRAAHMVLLELVRILGEYRDNLVVIGGWVPTLIFGDKKEKHVGSIDVDIALDHTVIGEPAYKTILRLLAEHGYQAGEQPYIFFRSVVVEGSGFEVEVDLLAGEYRGTGRKHRTQLVQDARVRKARGCDLAFELPLEKKITGILPGGARDQARVRVASMVPFIVMKGMALHDRIKEKDGYDIYYCVKHCSGGIEKLAAEFKPFLNNGLVKEALVKVRDKFLSTEHFGPRSAADFEEIADPEERALVQRDAFERVNALLKALGI